MESKISLDDAIRAIVKEENSILLNKIKDLLNSKGSAVPSKPMTLDEAVEYLGVSKSFLYKMTSATQIPHAKRGKRLYFERDKLDAWLLENKVRTVAEIKETALSFLSKPKRRI
jgi:excisionase family DNA binding protein